MESKPSIQFYLVLPGIYALNISLSWRTMMGDRPHSHSIVAGGLPEMS